MDDIRKNVLHDLQGAAKMIEQALNRLHPSLDLWREIRKIDEMIDDVRTGIEDRDFDLKD